MACRAGGLVESSVNRSLHPTLPAPPQRLSPPDIVEPGPDLGPSSVQLSSAQNVLHAQSRGTLAACSSTFALFICPWPEIILRWLPGRPAMGVDSPLPLPRSVSVSLLLIRRRLRDLSQRWNCRWQVSQARESMPDGWNLASWFRGIMKAVCSEQKMWPQCRQWCLRTKRLNEERHCGESQVGEASSG